LVDRTENLALGPVAALLGLSLVWGANWAMAKMGAQDIAPLFMAALRSGIAAALLYGWMRLRGVTAFHRRDVIVPGIVSGLAFGLEFALIYAALPLTYTSHIYVLVYTAPFSAAIGAHFFLTGDRLHPWKIVGLTLAFVGIVVLFGRQLGSRVHPTVLAGDLMALAAGALWGSTTVYIKKTLVHRSRPVQYLFYELLFSFPLLLVLSLLFEPAPIRAVTWTGGASLFYQAVIVAFLSYLAWMHLVGRYPVSLVHAFSFFTPCFGVLISGVLILREPITWNLIAALVLVSLGLMLVNKKIGKSVG
jgi:drug/metabolite transporter (DMT)-like permease